MGFPRQLGGLPGCLEFYGPLVGLAARARGGVASTGQGVVCPSPVAVLGPGSTPPHTHTVLGTVPPGPGRGSKCWPPCPRVGLSEQGPVGPCQRRRNQLGMEGEAR